jgi:putative DNA methylase
MTAALTKRLIEVDLPIKRISGHARREKSIRHGHISTLHIWWARRPLAACRAVICAALWLDPADFGCPDAFRQVARTEMARWVKDNLKLLSKESLERFISIQKNPEKLNDNTELRYALLDFIADFANWDNSTVKEFLDTSRALTQAAHEALGGVPGSKPLVVDPFAGGGSIPLEALRVGADAFASDLNPVSVLLNKVVLEYIPKYGQRLADEVRKWGEWIKREAEKELAEFYPKDADGAAPIAYLWARTIRCEGPGCGAEVPVTRSLWLARKGSRCVALQLIPNATTKSVGFQIIVKQRDGGWADQANSESRIDDPKFEGTAKRGSVTCPCCNYTTPVTSVRRQLKTRQGGANDAKLMCVVRMRPNQSGRIFQIPQSIDIEAINRATAELRRREQRHRGNFPLVPDEPLPVMSGVFNAPIYGHNTWGSLFTPRQSLALSTLVRLIGETATQLEKLIGDKLLATAVQTCLAFNFSRVADLSNSLCGWKLDVQCPTHLFSRQAIPMTWDFSESVCISESSGSWSVMTERFADILLNIGADWSVGSVQQLSATRYSLPDDSAMAFITDPPYYNAVPYADLSDFFYVWFRRMLGDRYPELFSTPLSPKDDEACQMAGWDPVRYPHKDSKWFEQQMGLALGEGRRILHPRGIGTVVFAHKTTAGWEALLQALIDAGWIITASWPIDTEMDTRLRAQDSAALASSVHLVCRPRESSDDTVRTNEIGDWRDVLQELPRRIDAWMPRLAEEGVVGADAIFACIGPALEIFSRYSSVEKASGQIVTLREYLEQVWAAVAKEALAMVFQGADASGFEEDARLTAMWLWTLFAGETSSGEPSVEAASEDEEPEEAGGTQIGYVLEYDTARKIAQGLGAHLESLTSLVEVKGEVARLLPVAERTRRLFGKDESEATTSTRKKRTSQLQLGFVAELEQAEEVGSWGSKGVPALGLTVLDRVHQCMILFAAGRGEALRRFLVDEGVGRDERFWRLAQVLSYLYPKSSDEKRWIDGVLARKKGLGF